jgi:hypothetical protein
MDSFETGCLVIGSGTAGLAFADTLIAESDACDFVRLHQASACNGVNALEPGRRRTDVAGLNQGLYELASGPEIKACFDEVMQHRRLPSGGGRYHPLSKHLGDGQLESLRSGRRTHLRPCARRPVRWTACSRAWRPAARCGACTAIARRRCSAWPPAHPAK